MSSRVELAQTLPRWPSRTHSLYAKVGEVLRAQITKQAWKPGDRLPSEAQLCAEFGVSSITVRRAIADLVAEGLVVRWQGKGTFVSADHAIVQGPPLLTSFTDDMRSRGWKSTSRVLSIRNQAAGSDIGRKLGIPPSALVTALDRVRIADQIPIAQQAAYLPAVIFPGLEQYDFKKESLYHVLEHAFAVRPLRSTDTYRAGKASRAEARLLQIGSGSPVFRTERTTLDGAGRTIEFVRSVVRGDRYALVVNLKASRGIGS